MTPRPDAPRRLPRAALAASSCLLFLAAAPPTHHPARDADAGLDTIAVQDIHPVRATHRVERTVWLMGTRARVEVDAGSRDRAVAASEAAVEAMSRVEDLLSTWRGDTDLASLNRSELHVPSHPHADVAGWLREMAGLTRRTGGAVHPAVGALVDAWDLRGDGRIPTEDERRSALQASGPRGIHVDPATGAVTRHSAEAWIDAGAFGKGAALRVARDRLEETGVSRAVIDLGGQLLHVGPEPATFTVAHPTDRDRPVAQVRIRDASVATSGQSERGFDIDGVRYGHILDPRDGRPVRAWGSVTVVSADPLEADALSTALYVMGPVAGYEWATDEGIAALFLEDTEAGVVEHGTHALEQHLERIPPRTSRAPTPSPTTTLTTR